MTYGRKPKYRESDYSIQIKSCMELFPNSIKEDREDIRRFCVREYEKTNPKNRRVSKRYPVKMKRR